jgi:hypothetical protein
LKIVFVILHVKGKKVVGHMGLTVFTPHHTVSALFQEMKCHLVVGDVILTKATFHVLVRLHVMILEMGPQYKGMTHRARTMVRTLGYMIFFLVASRGGTTGTNLDHFLTMRVEMVVHRQLCTLERTAIGTRMFRQYIGADPQKIFAVRRFGGKRKR